MSHDFQMKALKHTCTTGGSSTDAGALDLIAILVHAPAVTGTVPALHGQEVTLLVTLWLVESRSDLLHGLQLTSGLKLNSCRETCRCHVDSRCVCVSHPQQVCVSNLHQVYFSHQCLTPVP